MRRIYRDVSVGCDNICQHCITIVQLKYWFVQTKQWYRIRQIMLYILHRTRNQKHRH